jgi:hypothetical protein
LDGVSTIFGCWTSSSRKAVKPIIEKYQSLLWCPIQYEELEQSGNIMFTGSCLNQQFYPAVTCTLSQGWRDTFLVGSDYVFPRTADSLIRTIVVQGGGTVGYANYHLKKEMEMLAPEYRVGFRVLREKIGWRAELNIVIPAFFRALKIKHTAGEGSGEAGATKARLKNHFQLLANMYRMLEKRYGKVRTDEIMRDVLSEGGNVFFRGFARLRPGEQLAEFVEIYKKFESNNIVFDVLEETDKRFEIEIKRCLVCGAFNELGVPALTQWMCDIAFRYFSRYHPQMTYAKIG